MYFYKKLKLGKKIKIKNPISSFVVWIKEELNKPPEYRMEFPKELLKEK